jgi:hypothetical protein
MKSLEQIIAEIIILSKEGMIASIIWDDIANRCERYLKLVGVARLEQFKMDLNIKLNNIKQIKIDRRVQRFEDLIRELNNYDGR